MFQFLAVAPCPITTHHWRVCPHSVASCTSDIYKHWSDPLTVFSFLGWTDSGLSVFLCTGGAPGTLPFLWLSSGLCLGDPCLLWTEGPQTGHSVLNVASPEQRGRITSLDLLAMLLLNAPQDPFGLLGHMCTLLAHGLPVNLKRHFQRAIYSTLRKFSKISISDYYKNKKRKFKQENSH